MENISVEDYSHHEEEDLSRSLVLSTKNVSKTSQPSDDASEVSSAEGDHSKSELIGQYAPVSPFLYSRMTQKLSSSPQNALI